MQAKIDGIKPTHIDHERSPLLKAKILQTKADISRINKIGIKPNPIRLPTFSLIVMSINGRITAANIPIIGPLKIMVKPSPIAHQATFVFGNSLNLLIIGFFILFFWKPWNKSAGLFFIFNKLQIILHLFFKHGNTGYF